MVNSARPQITDDHKKKYAEIMGIQVKSASQPNSSSPPSSANSNSILSSIPKPKGLGNKMFIFTGKKKIVMEGTQREVENVKTVNPEPENALPADRQGVVPEKNETPAKEKEQKPIDNKLSEKPQEKKVNPSGKKKIPTFAIVIAGVLFVGVWVFFWLVFLGFISF